MKRKKILALLAVTALLAGTLAGCGGDSGAAGEAGSTGGAGESGDSQERLRTAATILPRSLLSTTMQTARTATGVRRR